MESKFDVLFLVQAREFLTGLSEKTRIKILYNIDKARMLNDPKLFKKLTGEIWEFRTKFDGLQYRFLAFWDKTEKAKMLVISTHGFVKKENKISAVEIKKANEMRKMYFRQKANEK